jgi:exosortase A-associated hydrolase 1
MLEKAHVFNSRGKQLVAIEHIPELNADLTPEIEKRDNSKKKGVIIVVGGPQTRVGSHRLFVFLARKLVKQGIHVFRFDYTGAGDSEGEVTAFNDVQADISAAVKHFSMLQPAITELSLWGLCDAASAILLYLTKYSNDSGDIHRLVLVNPWVRQTHTQAQTYLKSYYVKRFLSQNFWKKLLTGKVNTRTSLNEVHSFRQQSKQSADKDNFVEEMRQGLSYFVGKATIILSENDLTADEFKLLLKNDASWQKLMTNTNVSHLTVMQANHTFSVNYCKDELVNHTLKALL